MLLVLTSASIGATTVMDDAATCTDPELPAAAYPVGDIRNCPVFSPKHPSQPPYLMDVLPGGGFDSLRDLDMGQVYFYNYSTCRVSSDGKYLLPDDIFLVPVKKSRVELFAELFDHWETFSSTTSSSFKAGAKGGGFGVSVSGSFSDEHMSVKTHQVEDKANTTRVQLRQNLYIVKLQPGDSQLHPTFKNRVFEIAAHLQNNNTNHADYLSELLVRDFGTHYLTSIDAGAVLYQIDHVNSSYVGSSVEHKSKVTASASASFFGKFSFSTSASHSTDDKDTQAYLDNRMHSQIHTAGGPPFTPNMTIDEWEGGVPDNLVAVDRSGDPLYYAVNSITIPELPESTVLEIEDMVYRAVHRYYKVNTRFGCTNPSAFNFDFQANVDDGSCNYPPDANLTFGGVYQTCQLAPNSTIDICNSGHGHTPVSQVNPLTGEHSCPAGYQAIHLHSGTYTTPVTTTQCHTHSYKCHLFHWSTCHKKQCVSQVILTTADYQAYWCAGSGEKTGYLFSGFYTGAFVNPVTDSMSCPTYYIALHFGEDIEVCVSNDLEKAFSSHVPFGGFDSCKVGNPLAASTKNFNNSRMWPHSCPRGYARRLVTVDDGCEIYICIKSGSFNQSVSPLAPQLPPFRKRPSLKSNVSNTLAIVGVNGDLWLKRSTGTWEPFNGTISDDGYDFIASLDTLSDEPAEGESGKGHGSDSSNSLSSGVVAVISIASTLVFCTIIALAVFLSARLLRSRKETKGKTGGRETYLAINETGSGDNPEESNI